MIELVTKGGKKIGRIADSIGEEDTVIINGQSVTLTDAYDNEQLTTNFNKEVKALKLKDESK
jgi:hypothetical protein